MDPAEDFQKWKNAGTLTSPNWRVILKPGFRVVNEVLGSKSLDPKGYKEKRHFASSLWAEQV